MHKTIESSGVESWENCAVSLGVHRVVSEEGHFLLG
jgi:hypothetical protein